MSAKRLRTEYMDASLAGPQVEYNRLASELLDACLDKVKEELKRFAKELVDGCLDKTQETTYSKGEGSSMSAMESVKAPDGSITMIPMSTRAQELKRFAKELVDACLDKTQETTYSKGEGSSMPAMESVKAPDGSITMIPMSTRALLEEIKKNPMTRPSPNYLEELKGFAMEYLDACLAKLQETHQGVEFELVNVLYVHTSLTADKDKCRYAHVHFKAKPKDVDPQHQQSPQLFCAVIRKDGGNQVMGCNLLESRWGDDFEDGMCDEKNCVWTTKFMPPPVYYPIPPIEKDGGS